MEEIILEHLNSNYNVILSTFSSFKYITNDSISMVSSKLISDVCIIFGSSSRDEYIEGIINKWSKDKITKLSTKINHIKYQYYCEKGQDITSVDEMNKRILESTHLCT